MKFIFLIDRGAPPPNFHPGPLYRRVLVCGSSRVARRVAGDTADRCTVWQNFGSHNKARGLLLVRWQGLDVDYGVAFRPSVLPDGTPTGFHHRERRETWGLLDGAVWWCSDSMPTWLRKAGVVRYGPFCEAHEPALELAIVNDEAAATAHETGNRPFGFRAVPGWRALAASPAFREAFLPGMELAEV